MTHLKIELNNGIIEEVSSEIIEKLYNIVYNNDLDNTSNLIGRLHTSATYQDYIDYLEDTFKVNGVKQLVIDATKKYLMFEDPEVLRIVLSHNVGDGTGVSASDLISVTNISEWFRNNTTITSLNDLLKFTNVTSIKNIATNDTNLISVTLREGLLEISGNCFYNCSSLLTINFPSTLTKINDNRQYSSDWGAFQGCTSLTTITGGENITVLGPAFTNCSNLLNLGNIDLSNLIHLGGSCFSNCNNLELGSVTLSSNITTMGDRLFAECKKLTSINIPGVTTITPSNSFAQGSFYNCDHLTTVIGSNIAYIGQMSFRYCSALSSIDLSNCTYIGICAFLGCTSLLHVDFSQQAIITENDAFYGCTSLGINETLEINAIRSDSNNHNQPSRTFYGTRYKRFIYHAPTIVGIQRSEYAIFDGMTDLEYLDLSETSISDCAGGVPNTLTTKIESPSAVSIGWGAGVPSQYWIIPSSTMCTISNDFVRYNDFKSSKASCILYVLDSTVRDAYLADSYWSLIANISDRIKTLAELPAGVWTTGRASLYLTPALLATS